MYSLHQKTRFYLTLHSSYQILELLELCRRRSALLRSRFSTEMTYTPLAAEAAPVWPVEAWVFDAIVTADDY